MYSIVLVYLIVIIGIQIISYFLDLFEDIQSKLCEQSLVFDCLAAAFSLFHQATPIFRSELERRGFKDLVTRIQKRKDALPESLQKQLDLYFEKKKTQNIQQPEDTIVSALRCFNYDQELYEYITKTVFDLLTITREHSTQDIWDFIHTFIEKFRLNNDFQYALEESIQPSAHENTSIIEDLKRDLERAQQLTSATRHEMMQKNAAGMAEIKNRDNKIQELESKLYKFLAPPPPPPPPPPIAPNSSMKHYLHPLTVDLRFDPHHETHIYTPSQRLVDTKQLFWSKLPLEKINNTVWNEIMISETSSVVSSDSDEEELDIPKIDINELNRLFKKPTAIQASERKSSSRVTLLNFNRANNIAIMLAKIKLTFSEIHDAIWNMDDRRLSVENLSAIRQYVPTAEEIEIVSKYHGCLQSLGDAEQYFRAVMNIPRLENRINCMVYKKRFRYELKELQPGLNTLQVAIIELKQSARFKAVLKAVLDIGNHLNGQTVRGNAFGFHLDALLKMKDTKSEGEGVPTLLHYLVDCLSKSHDDIVSFTEDFSHLQAATKVSPHVLIGSINALYNGLISIKHEITKNTDSTLDPFYKVMNDFVSEAEPLVDRFKRLSQDIQDKLQDLLIYYGEDPNTIKPEAFFDIITTFSSSFEKAQNEILEAKEKCQQHPHIKRELLIASYSKEKNFECVLKELKAGLRHRELADDNDAVLRNKKKG